MLYTFCTKKMAKVIFTLFTILSLLCNTLLGLDLRADVFREKHYQFEEGAIRFADYDRLRIATLLSHLPKNFYDTQVLKASTETALLGGLESLIGIPFGAFTAGELHSALNRTIELIKEMRNMNKLAKIFNFEKSSPLEPYLGDDGVELLRFSLRSSWPALKINDEESCRKKQVYIKALDKFSRLHAVAGPFELREITEHFVFEFQKRWYHPGENGLIQKEAKGEEYETAVDQFVRNLGLIVFSQQTLRHLAIQYNMSEEKLYHILRDGGVLNNHFGLRKHYRSGLIYHDMNSKKILHALGAGGIFSIKLCDAILHDLGFVSHNDILTIVDKALVPLATGKMFSKSERNELARMSNVEGSLNHLINFYDAKKSLSLHMRKYLIENRAEWGHHLNVLAKQFFGDEERFKEAIDLAILKIIVSKSEFRSYQFHHFVKSSLGGKGDALILRKLTFLDVLHLKVDDKYNYFDLEHDLDLLRGEILKVLDKQHIQNKIFTIISVKYPKWAEDILLYLPSVGFISVEALEMIVDALSMVTILSEGALAAVDITLPLANGVAGALLILVSAIEIVKECRDLTSLYVSERAQKLLNAHLQNIPVEQLDDTTKSAILMQNFEFASTHYLNKIKGSLITHQLGLNLIWAVVGTSFVALGVLSLLAFLGVAFAVASIAAASLFTYGALYPILMIPLVILLKREYDIEKRLEVSKNVIEFYNEALTHIVNNKNIEDKKKEFLKLFFEDATDLIRLGGQEMKLKEHQIEIARSKDIHQIANDVIGTYRDRRKALSYFKRLLRKGPVAKDLASKMVEPNLNCAFKKTFKKDVPTVDEFLDQTTPSYFRSGADLLLESVNPTVEISDVAKNYVELQLPEECSDDYFRDQHLLHLFQFVNVIFNDFQKNLYEYNFVLRKQYLQYHYFGVSVSDREVDLLQSHLKNRHANIIDHYRAGYLDEDINALCEMHSDEDNSAPNCFWGEDLFEDIDRLIEFDQRLVDKGLTIQKSSINAQTIFPPHHKLKHFIQLFLSPDVILYDHLDDDALPSDLP